LPQQNNSRPDKSAAAPAAIACLEFTVLPYAVYSLDLASSDLHLLPKLTADLRGQHFSSDEAVKDAVCQWFKEKKKNTFLRREFKNLLDDTKNVVKLDEIMWKSAYAQFINKG
jgi:hypothetical protein